MKIYLPILLLSVVLMSSCYQHHSCNTYSKANQKMIQEIDQNNTNQDHSL